MDEGVLDYVLIPIGILVMGGYHSWLLFTIRRSPMRTVIGINAESRHQWVHAVMNDPLKNGVLAVQTLRNNIMASTLLATTAIALSSLMAVFVGSGSNSMNNVSKLIYGNKSSLVSSTKYFSILLCFFLAFLCNVQSIRYYAHVSFLISVPRSKGQEDYIDYVSWNLNRGSFFWSLGLRAFYLSFPLFLWVFGPIPMLGCSCLISSILYFLDTTTRFARHLHAHAHQQDIINGDDLELACTLP